MVVPNFSHSATGDDFDARTRSVYLTERTFSGNGGWCLLSTFRGGRPGWWRRWAGAQPGRSMSRCVKQVMDCSPRMGARCGRGVMADHRAGVEIEVPCYLFLHAARKNNAVDRSPRKCRATELLSPLSLSHRLHCFRLRKLPLWVYESIYSADCYFNCCCIECGGISDTLVRNLSATSRDRHVTNAP